jgi:uncharacterized protein YutE (UPF0331/DUF86 family)
MELYSRKFELIDECVERLSSIKKDNPSLKKYRTSWKDKDASERNLQKVIEAIIDIGKMVISEKKLREPGNNREVFLILEENKLFPSEFIPLMDRMIGMRNIIVHSYDIIDDGIVYGVLKKNLKDIKRLSSRLKKNLFKMTP